MYRNTKRTLRRLAAAIVLTLAAVILLACSPAATPTPTIVPTATAIAIPLAAATPTPTPVPTPTIWPTPTAGPTPGGGPTVTPTAPERCGPMCRPEFWATADVAAVRHELSKQPDLRAPGGLHGGSALNVAAARSDEPVMIGILLDAGAALEYRSVEKVKTPLIAASAINPNPRMATILLDRGADISATNRDGHTAPMAAAAFNPNPAVANALLDRGAELEATDEATGITALHAAVLNRNPNMMALLLNRGANAGHRLNNGDTVTHTYAELGTAPTVGAVLLLHSRHHLWTRNHNAETPCQIASERVSDYKADPPFTREERDEIIRLLCRRLQPNEEP